MTELAGGELSLPLRSHNQVGASRRRRRRRRILALPWGNVRRTILEYVRVCVCACACMRVTYAIMAGIHTCNDD